MIELLFIWILSIVASTVIGSRKGRTKSGFILGLVFGPLGILFAFLLQGNRIRCEHCQAFIHRQVTTCPHCHKEVAGETKRGFWSTTSKHD